MLRRHIGFAWKILPPWLRLRIIRTTQQKFTVSAAVVITNPKGEVLLLNHLLRPYSGWGLPGGFLTAGEQPEEGIRRELREETGLELGDLEMIRVRTVGRHVEIMFRATSAGDAKVLSREITGLGWFHVDQLPAGLPKLQKEIVKESVLTSER